MTIQVEQKQTEEYNIEDYVENAKNSSDYAAVCTVVAIICVCFSFQHLFLMGVAFIFQTMSFMFANSRARNLEIVIRLQKLKLG